MRVYFTGTQLRIGALSRIFQLFQVLPAFEPVLHYSIYLFGDTNI